MASPKKIQYNIRHKDGSEESVEGSPVRDADFLAIRDAGDVYSVDHIPSGAFVVRLDKLNLARAFAQAVVHEDPEGVLLQSAANRKLAERQKERIKALMHFRDYLRECDLRKEKPLPYESYLGLMFGARL